MILLQTKFLIPRFTAARIARPHLTGIVRDNIDQRFILLIAPPGYGKTMLMADAAASLGCPVLWYQLDEGDSDPATFMAYLVEGLCQTLPEQGARIREILADSGVYPPERALVILLNQLCQTPPPRWVLALDDYHLVTNSAAHRLTASLLDNAPPGMSVMIASRSTPSLPLSRWRARGQLLELRPEQLRFSPLEASQWLANSQHPLPDEEVRQIVETTEGWGAGLQLALNLLAEQTSGDTSAFTAKLRGAHQHIFNYLMEEIFSHQAPDVQRFLLDSCVLTQLNAETCQQVLGMNDARRLLEQIENDGLFLFSLDSQREWFRYHHLFREFLLEKLAREDQEHLCALRRRAARYHEARRELETALQYALAANDNEHAAHILSGFALDWLEQGYVEALNRYFHQLDPHIQTMPELLLLYGRALRHVGYLPESNQRFQQAYAVAMNLNMQDTAYRAINEQASLARSQGDYERAAHYAGQVVRVSEFIDPKTRAFGLMELAKSKGFLEGMHLGSTLATQAVEAMEEAGATISPFEQAQLLRSLAQICWWHGDVNAAIRHGQDALRRIPNKHSPLAAEIMMTLATPSLYRHDYHAARAYAEQALTICHQLEVKELLPTAFATLGNILTRLGKLDEAEQALRQAIEMATDLGAERYAQIMAAGYLAYNLFVHGRVQDAIQVAETALWSHEGLPIVYEVYVCRSVLADSYLSDGQTLRAERIFAELIELGEKRQYRIPLSMAYFGLAYIRLKSGDRAEGIALALRSLELLESSMAWELYVDQGERALVVCGVLAEVQPHNSFVQQVMATLTRPVQQGITVASPSLVQIQTFGGFRVFRDGQELPAKAWVSGKARDLLAFFVTHRKDSITVERALEAIWNAEGERGSTAFHTALHRLRGALKTGSETAKFIHVEGGFYTLDTERFEIDADQFDQLIRQARTASPIESITLYERAVLLYKGAYLENLDYFWVFGEQERLKKAYLQALQALEHHWLQYDDVEKCLHYAQQQLHVDPLQESVHCAIMRYYARMGNHTELVRQYRRLQTLLQENLGTAPSPAAQQLFARLSGN